MDKLQHLRKRLPSARPMFSQVELISYEQALQIRAQEENITLDEARERYPEWIPRFDGRNDFHKELDLDCPDDPDSNIFTIMCVIYKDASFDFYYDLGFIDSDGDLEELDTSDYFTEKFFKPDKKHDHDETDKDKKLNLEEIVVEETFLSKKQEL